MINPLNDLERRLQTLIENDLVKFLKKPVTDERIARLLADALQAVFSSQAASPAGSYPSPEIMLAVHSSKMDLWLQDPRLMLGLNTILQQVVKEKNIQFSTTPRMQVIADNFLDVDQIEIRIIPSESVAETQNMLSNNGDSSVRAAFLIVGGTNVFTLNRAVTNIGRQTDNHIILDDPRVSRYHAQIRFVRNHYLVFDLNSTGGTSVNGQRASQSILYPGDVISLAGLQIIFGQDSQPPTASKGDTAPLSPASSERTTVFLKRPLPKNENNS